MSSREIKFRGRRLRTKEWMHGALIPSEFSHWNAPSIADRNFRYEVDKETIGQFTGYKDATGREIYEGDIIDFTVFDLNDTDTEHRGVVTFDSGWEIWKDTDTLFDGNIAYCLRWVWEQDEEIRVVGNVYDNPEMVVNDEAKEQS